MKREKIIYLNLYLGLIILISSEILLFLKISFIQEWFFCVAWWSYILVVDSLNFRRTKNSLLFSSGKNFLFMAFISVFTWLIFELFNLRVDSWSYHHLPENIFKRWLGYFLGFATVIPALWETASFIESFFERKKTKFSIPITKVFLSTSIGAGLISVPLFLSFPRFFFPLVWLCFMLLIPPINYILKIKGILKDLKEGYWGRIISWLLTGFIAGLLWEFWNYWSLSRWRYSIPYFNFLKIFEMPVLGYFGFLPFSLGVFSIYQFILLVKKKVEKYNLLKWTVFIFLILFYLFCFWLIDKFTLH
ncbi:MAG: hypothetical protein ACE5WD_00765 [Candidatus Aminicenantia bacterium]